MHVTLTPGLQGNAAAEAAAKVVGKCVHCGFCNASCPTYRLLGDELDGPRGRIYLMKGLLEGAPASTKTQLHLDRCLTCRACETACPSGVDYGQLLETGRALSAVQSPRPAADRWRRALLRATLTRRWLFGTALRLGQAVRPWLPPRWRAQIPARPRAPFFAGPAVPPAVQAHADVRPPALAKAVASPPVAQRRVLLLSGCVQPALAPGIERATVRVLEALGIAAVVAPAAGCCGALRQHLDDPNGALDEARRNIDAWWPYLATESPVADNGNGSTIQLSEPTVEAIISTASGCGVQLHAYGRLLQHDPVYAARAAAVAALVRDLVEVVAPEAKRLAAQLRPETSRVVFQAPCTLQHGLRLRGMAEALLVNLGADLLPCADSGTCCGSAGTYSLLQPEISQELRSRKLAALQQGAPAAILSANVGCIAHLGYAAAVPVGHWVEWAEARLLS